MMCPSGCEHTSQTSAARPASGFPLPGVRLANLLAPYDPPVPTDHRFLPPFLETILSPAAHKKGDEGRPQFEVADIFRLYGDAYRATHNLTSEQLGVM